ncbi:MAG: CocE/NonD family hydrolase C-terminal non-catalytic domain-containing protein [Thermaerobacterales bacterium]
MQVSNAFQIGHCIRVDISSSNFPRFDANPNTGEPMGRQRPVEAAVNAVHHGSVYPSNIVLRVIPSI